MYIDSHAQLSYGYKIIILGGSSSSSSEFSDPSGYGHVEDENKNYDIYELVHSHAKTKIARSGYKIFF